MTDSNQGVGNRRPSEGELDAFLPQTRGGREARLGIFVILGLLSFVMVLFMLTDPATLRGRYMVHTVVDDAGGVRRGDPIQMRGVNIGRIHAFEMRDDGLVTITLEVEGEWQIPVGSSTQLGAAGVFGGRTVEVVPGGGPGFVSPDDTIPGVGGSAGGILGSVDHIGEQAEAVLGQLEVLLDDPTIGSVQGGARQLEGLLTELSGMIAEQRGALQDLTESLRRSAAGVEEAAEAGPEVASAIARADSAMAMLMEASEQIDGTVASLRSILTKVDNGEGTLGRLVNDQTLYDNLNDASLRIAELVQDIKDNPRKYISLSIF